MLNLTKSELKFLEMLLQLNFNHLLNNYEYENDDSLAYQKIIEIKENFSILTQVRKELDIRK